jgi:deoxyribodipyrimidine photolyase
VDGRYGTDAAPYFRVMNPVRQARRFDPHGTYVRRHVPERYRQARTEAG